MINPVSLLQRLARGRIPLLSAALAGLVALALNAAAADYVHARLMGLDPDRFSMLKKPLR